MKPVCLIIGAGAGIGGHVGKRFAKAGYHAVLCRRTHADGLKQLVDDIESKGGSASGYLLNVVEADSLEERIASIESDIGPIEVRCSISALRSETARWRKQRTNNSRSVGGSQLIRCFDSPQLCAP